jgi:hypothetical protein
MKDVEKPKKVKLQGSTMSRKSNSSGTKSGKGSKMSPAKSKSESPVRKSLTSKSEKNLNDNAVIHLRNHKEMDGNKTQQISPSKKRLHKSRNLSAYYDASASFADSSNSVHSSNSSLSRLRIRPAFELRSVNSKLSQYSKASGKSKRSKINIRDASQFSQRSLSKIHTFALKNQKEEGEKKEGEEEKEEVEAEMKPVMRAKVYYMEEHVKMLSEIISQAEPILNELASQVYQF